MGKILSRFKFGRSLNSKYHNNNKNSYNTEPDFDDIQYASSPRHNEQNSAKMTNLSSRRLNEIDNFQEFDNVLSVNCNKNSSICMFGKSDYVISINLLTKCYNKF